MKVISAQRIASRKDAPGKFAAIRAAEDHDEPEGDDTPEQRPGPQHPCAMLVDLQTLDVDVCQHQTYRRQQHQRANEASSAVVPAKSVCRDHESAGLASGDEEEDDVPRDTVVDDSFIPDDGDELEDGEEAGGEDGGEVEDDADVLLAVGFVPVAFTGGCAGAGGGAGIAKHAVEVGVLETSEGEAEEGAAEDGD